MTSAQTKAHTLRIPLCCGIPSHLTQPASTFHTIPHLKEKRKRHDGAAWATVCPNCLKFSQRGDLKYPLGKNTFAVCVMAQEAKAEESQLPVGGSGS